MPTLYLGLSSSTKCWFSDEITVNATFIVIFDLEQLKVGVKAVL